MSENSSGGRLQRWPLHREPRGGVPCSSRPPTTTGCRPRRRARLSETAFVQRRGATFALRGSRRAPRWRCAGMPTLAAAHVLREHGWVRATEPMVFATRSGHSASPPGVRSSRWTSLRPRPRRPHCPLRRARGAGLRALRAFPRARARRRSSRGRVCADLDAITRAGPEMVLVTARVRRRRRLRAAGLLPPGRHRRGPRSPVRRSASSALLVRAPRWPRSACRAALGQGRGAAGLCRGRPCAHRRFGDDGLLGLHRGP